VQHRPAATKTPPETLPEPITPLTTPLPAITLKSKPFDLAALLQQVSNQMADMDRRMAEMATWPKMPTMPTTNEDDDDTNDKATALPTTKSN